MAGITPDISPSLAAFLRPLHVDREITFSLAGLFAETFTHLAANSLDQFLPTPISESVLLHSAQNKTPGRYLAIDIGGTNLRVGFIELLPGVDDGHPAEIHPAVTNGQAKVAQQPAEQPVPEPLPPAAENPGAPRLRRLHERSWPIQEHLKSENAERLFAWIGSCIADVVHAGCVGLGQSVDAPLPMGVTFSFPMEQTSLVEAKLMSMGKGFAITSQLDLGTQLSKGYERARAERAGRGLALPPISIAAIVNDAVATLVLLMYEQPSRAGQRPAMGLICGTGSNATLLLKRGSLHPSKRPRTGDVIRSASGGGSDEEAANDVKLAVNTEWSINGSAPAMRAVGLINRWDDMLSSTVESPGFQPLEYMTAGRYLGELGRIVLMDYLTTVLGVDEANLPSSFRRRFDPHNTTFLSHYRPGRAQSLLSMLEAQFPIDKAAPAPTHGLVANGHGHGNGNSNSTAAFSEPHEPGQEPFRWTEEMAEALYHIAKAVEMRAAAIIAAAIVGLLDFAGALPEPGAAGAAACASSLSDTPQPLELVVGYTGGCITNFQDYLADCQAFLDDTVKQRYQLRQVAWDDSQLDDDARMSAPAAFAELPESPPPHIVLRPCHDGGIKGAGILVPASLVSQGLAGTSAYAGPCQ